MPICTAVKKQLNMKYQIPYIAKLLTYIDSIRINVKYFDKSETGQNSLFNIKL